MSCHLAFAQDSIPLDNSVEEPFSEASEQALPPAPVPISPPPDTGPYVLSLKKYNFFSGAPPIPGTRRIMASGEAPEVYVVEPGDTLYDICDQLLDEPEYWPKLWAINPEIKNPHFIYPGMNLRFYPGDEDTPPYLEVITEDDMVPIDKDELKEEELIVQDISRLILEDEVEGDVPVIGLDQVTDTTFDNRIEVVGDYFRPSSTSVILPALVYDEPREPEGVVIYGTSGHSLVSEEGRLVLEGENLKEESIYLILRESEDVYRPSDDEFVGYRYEVVGTVKVEKKVEDETYVGVVNLSRLGAKPDDILVPYTSIIRQFPENPRNAVAGSGNEVVGFEYPKTHVGGELLFVLFEKLSGNLSEGQLVKVFQLYEQSALLVDPDDLPDVGQYVGEVYIVDASTQVAIGVGIRGDQEIREGDTAGPPKTEEDEDEGTLDDDESSEDSDVEGNESYDE